MSELSNNVKKSDIDKGINKLATAGKSLIELATPLLRQTASWCMSPEASGNCEPLSRFVQALFNLDHKGLAQKAIHWIEDATPFKLAADTVAPTFRMRKKSPMQIRDESVWVVDFTKYKRDPAKKADWTLEAAIKKAIAKALRDHVVTDEAEARKIAANAALGYVAEAKVIKVQGEATTVDAQEAPKAEARFVAPAADLDAA